MTTVNTYFKTKPIRLKGYKLKKLKEDCIKRDRVCLYSKMPCNLQAHHVKYLSQGGSDILENLATVTAEVHDRIHKLATLKVTGVYPNFIWEEVE